MLPFYTEMQKAPAHHVARGKTPKKKKSTGGKK